MTPRSEPPGRSLRTDTGESESLRAPGRTLVAVDGRDASPPGRAPWSARSRWVTGALLVAFLGTLLYLARLEEWRVTHADLELDDGTPATLYLPGSFYVNWILPAPPPPEQRPPVVILVHALAADRALMSTLARRLAGNGYAALAIDLPGHGASRLRMPLGRGRIDVARPTLAQALSFARSCQQVDGRRVALVGHSVGAIAALDLATHEPGLSAVITLSGGLVLSGAHRPPNLLALVAGWDSRWVAASSRAAVAELAQQPEIRPSQTYGSFRDGTAAAFDTVAGVEHTGMVLSRAAAGRIIPWLDSSFGLRRTEALDLRAPRWWAIGLHLVIWTCLLPALAALASRFSSRIDWSEPLPTVRSLAFVGGATAIVLPLVGTGETLGAFIRLQAADILAPAFALIGVALLATVAGSAQVLRRMRATEFGASLAAGAVAFLGVAAGITPVGPAIHQLSVSQERLFSAAILAPHVGLFFLGLELTLRRGSPRHAALLSLAGRAACLGLVMAATAFDVVPRIAVLVLPLFVALALPVELVAHGIYRRTGNVLAIAVFETLVFTWLTAAVMPM